MRQQTQGAPLGADTVSGYMGGGGGLALPRAASGGHTGQHDAIRTPAPAPVPGPTSTPVWFPRPEPEPGLGL